MCIRDSSGTYPEHRGARTVTRHAADHARRPADGGVPSLPRGCSGARRRAGPEGEGPSRPTILDLGTHPRGRGNSRLGGLPAGDDERLAAPRGCLLYTSDAADDLTRVDL